MLEEYKRKRHFDKTPEPESDPFDSSEGPLRFVVQKHDATRLHYDVRLEVDGAMKSWAVPKGPSTNPADKHLAVMVEDHPISYNTFEGQIPKGEYGAGSVIIWDRGTYDCDHAPGQPRAIQEKQMLEDLAKGKLSVTFHGEKLRGSWTFVHTRGRTNKGNEWLLIKHHDEFVSDRDITLENRSVVTGRTIEDVMQGKPGKAVKPSKKVAKGKVKTPAEFSLDGIANLPGSKKTKIPEFLAPMLLTEVEKAFSNPDWLFELKLDGIRAIAIKDGKDIRLLSRNGNDIAQKFPGLATDIRNLPYEQLALDGEIVVFDDQGKPSFQELIGRFSLQNERDIKQWDSKGHYDFLLFDVMYLDGSDLRGVTLQDRRKVLEALGIKTSVMRIVDVFPTEGELLYEHARKMGIEGVVGKRLTSTYKEGNRSRDWVKIKGYHTEEFLVCGYTKGEGARASTFGALILGRMEGAKMQFCGSVGGGFGDAQLVQIKKILDDLPPGRNPFGSVPALNGKPVWLEPSLVVEVRFMTRTKEGLLRFPVFQRLRPDVVLPSTTMKTRSASNSKIDEFLEPLSGERNDAQLTVEGHALKFSNLNKALWPGSADTSPITKRDLVAYYSKVSHAILPHLKDRPLAIVRFPEGIGGEQFFQKHIDKGRPDYVEVVNIFSTHNGRAREWLMCNNLASLLWLGQMGTLEIHPWYSRTNNKPDAKDKPTDFDSSDAALDESVLTYPDFIVFDLDPVLKDKENPFDQETYKKTADVSMALKDILDGLKLKSYVKTSGKTGLHIYVPICRVYTYQETRAIAETIGHHLVKIRHKDVTMEWTVSKRPTSKIFYDHNQNVRGKTLASIYSVRPVPGAPVSFPLHWDEVLESHPPDFNIYTVPSLLAERGERWADILDNRSKLEFK
jgi:bifunctional non-homologous end joining protein LigD